MDIVLSSSIYVILGGVDIQPITSSNILEVVVDQHAHLPGMFTLRLFDPRMELLYSGLLNPAQGVEIISVAPDGNRVRLIQGQITAIEPVFGPDHTVELLVRGYDFAYRLYRHVRSRAFLNVKDSDLAERIAQEWGLQPVVEKTATVYHHIYQHNQSDLEFLLERAWRIGYECFVRDDRLYFRRPNPLGQASVTLAWGDDLLSFHPRMSFAEQVNEVIVRGWDWEQQKLVVGRAREGRLYAKVNDFNRLNWSGQLGQGTLVVVDQPVDTQAEADILAAARLDELSGVFVSAEGLAFRRPDILAGEEVALLGLGEQFSGTFLVTSATHTFSASDGFETHFTVQGTRTGLVSDMMTARMNQNRWFGLYTAIVTNTNDPTGRGQVKVRFPWLDDSGESYWVRVSTLGGGGGQGLTMLPSVNDQVLVAFEHGDFDRPVIVGSLPKPPQQGNSNGTGAGGYPAGSVPAGKTPKSENGRITNGWWQTSNGHGIAIQDSQTEQTIEIRTAGGHTLLLDEIQNTITLSTAKGQTITLNDQNDTITITSKGSLEITSKGSLNLNTNSNLNLSAGGQINLKGKQINLN